MAAHKTIVALAGGVGAARFLDGLARVVDPTRLFIIGNTADDAEIHGLHISPDLDTVMYTLAGMAHPGRGWGIRRDTFRCLEALGRLGADTWFQLGDCDLATNLFRTEMLRAGKPLSEVTQRIAASLGVRATIVPMTDDRVRTRVKTRSGDLEFQTYFVKRHARDAVLGVRFEGAWQARAAAGVTEAIRKAAVVVVCPSNPFISVGPILAVRGVRAALRETAAPVVAISPIVGGRALKGPAAHMMKSMGIQVSAAAVAELYQDFLDAFVLDRIDQGQAPRVESLGMRAIVANTVMTGLARKKALASVVVRSVGL